VNTSYFLSADIRLKQLKKRKGPPLPHMGELIEVFVTSVLKKADFRELADFEAAYKDAHLSGFLLNPIIVELIKNGARCNHSHYPFSSLLFSDNIISDNNFSSLITSSLL